MPSRAMASAAVTAACRPAIRETDVVMTILEPSSAGATLGFTH